MTQARVKGFVVGYDIRDEFEVSWTVRVKDRSSANEGKKFKVHSLHPGTMITKKGDDVTFVVAPIQVGNEQVMKAVDVAIGEVSSSDAKADSVPNVDDALTFYASEMDGSVSVVCTNMSRDEVALELKQNPGEELLDHASITLHPEETPPRHYGFGADADEYYAALDSIASMMGLEPFKNAVEYLATRFYIAGRNSKN